MAVAPDGTVYVGDAVNYRIRRVNPAGIITTLTGNGSGGFTGDGGPAGAAQIYGTYNLALDAASNLYFTDEGNLRIREVTTAGSIKTVAGNGVCGTPATGVSAINAPLCDVESGAVDSQGRVFLARARKSG